MSQRDLAALVGRILLAVIYGSVRKRRPFGRWMT